MGGWASPLSYVLWCLRAVLSHVLPRKSGLQKSKPVNTQNGSGPSTSRDTAPAARFSCSISSRKPDSSGSREYLSSCGNRWKPQRKQPSQKTFVKLEKKIKMWKKQPSFEMLKAKHYRYISYIIYYILYIIYYILYIMDYTLYIIYYILYIIFYILYIIYNVLYILYYVLYILYYVFCIIYYILYIIYYILYIIYYILCIMYYILYIIHYILYIMYYTLYIIYYILYIIYYILCIIYYILYIIYYILMKYE